MRRKVLWAGIGTGLVAVYVGASWFCGRLMDRSFEAWQQDGQSKLAPFVVVEREYTPGIFRSSHLVTLQLDASAFERLWRAKSQATVAAARSDAESTAGASVVQAATSQQESAPDPVQPVKLTLRNDVVHGPLPGFSSVGLARIQTHLVLSDATRQALSEVLGDKEPISMVTHIGLAGSGVTEFTSPGFDVTHQGDKISWQGVEARLAYGRNLDSLKCTAKAPGLTLNGEARQFVLSEVSMDCDMTRIVDDLYAGSMQVKAAGFDGTFAEAGVRKRIDMQNMGYSADITHTGGYVDMAAKMDLGKLEADEISLSDVAYHLTLKHIHAPTYAALVEQVQSSLWNGSDPAAALAMMSTFQEFVPTLLEHDPELVLDRISFTLPEGAASVSGSVRLVGFEREDMAGFGALSKLEAVADVSVAEALIEKDWSKVQAGDVDSPASGAAKLDAFRSQVAQMEQQGFVVRRDGKFESHVEFKQGQLTVNGKRLR